MDPPTYPFEETSFMDGPLAWIIWDARQEKNFGNNQIFFLFISKTFKFQ